MNGLLKKNNEVYSLFVKEVEFAFYDKNRTERPLNSLSIKNCEAIANGYDLDELKKDFANNHKKESDMAYEYGRDMYSFQKGFQKAVELLGDKKFSELYKKIDSMVDFAKNHFTTDAYDIIQMFVDNLKVNIQKIQQQTEFDVVITKEYLSNKGEWKEVLLPSEWEIETQVRYKTDADGCLILKRKG